MFLVFPSNLFPEVPLTHFCQSARTIPPACAALEADVTPDESESLFGGVESGEVINQREITKGDYGTMKVKNNPSVVDLPTECNHFGSVNETSALSRDNFCGNYSKANEVFPIRSREFS